MTFGRCVQWQGSTMCCTLALACRPMPSLAHILQRKRQVWARRTRETMTPSRYLDAMSSTRVFTLPYPTLPKTIPYLPYPKPHPTLP